MTVADEVGGVVYLMTRASDMRFIDSPDAICRRQFYRNNDACHGLVKAWIMRESRVLATLPVFGGALSHGERRTITRAHLWRVERTATVQCHGDNGPDWSERAGPMVRGSLMIARYPALGSPRLPATQAGWGRRFTLPLPACVA